MSEPLERIDFPGWRRLLLALESKVGSSRERGTVGLNRQEPKVTGQRKQ